MSRCGGAWSVVRPWALAPRRATVITMDAARMFRRTGAYSVVGAIALVSTACPGFGKTSKRFSVDEALLGPGVPGAGPDGEGLAWDGVTTIPSSVFAELVSSSDELTYDSAVELTRGFAVSYPTPNIEAAVALTQDGKMIYYHERGACHGTEPYDCLLGALFNGDRADAATQFEIDIYQYEIDGQYAVVSVDVLMAEVDYPYDDGGMDTVGAVNVVERTGGAVLFVETSRQSVGGK